MLICLHTDSEIRAGHRQQVFSKKDFEKGSPIIVTAYL